MRSISIPNQYKGLSLYRVTFTQSGAKIISLFAACSPQDISDSVIKNMAGVADLEIKNIGVVNLLEIEGCA